MDNKKIVVIDPGKRAPLYMMGERKPEENAEENAEAWLWKGSPECAIPRGLYTWMAKRQIPWPFYFFHGSQQEIVHGGWFEKSRWEKIV